MRVDHNIWKLFNLRIGHVPRRPVWAYGYYLYMYTYGSLS